jgi:hypothetical protein
MLTKRSRRLTVVLATGALSLVGAVGAFATVQGPAVAGAKTAAVGEIPAKGLAPSCLFTPQSPDCTDGIVS